jgi:hypothetical protein
VTTVAVTARPLANTAFTDDDQLERTLRRGLRYIQQRPHLIDGCLAGTGLIITPLQQSEEISSPPGGM